VWCVCAVCSRHAILGCCPPALSALDFRLFRCSSRAVLLVTMSHDVPLIVAAGFGVTRNRPGFGVMLNRDAAQTAVQPLAAEAGVLVACYSAASLTGLFVVAVLWSGLVRCWRKRGGCSWQEEHKDQSKNA
jgi:hypothetical protein